jgi:hypothetical protein
MVQEKNNNAREIRAVEHPGNERGTATQSGDTAAQAAVAQNADRGSGQENSLPERPTAGFTRTLIAKSERPSSTHSLVQRTENLQLGSDDELVCT